MYKLQGYVRNQNGKAINAASVSVYDYGTLDLVSLFSDSDGLVATDNPITTDSLGYYGAYLSPGRYDITAVSGSDSKAITDVQIAATVS